MQNRPKKSWTLLATAPVLLGLLAASGARAQQEAPPKPDQAEEFRNIVKDLFGDLIPGKTGDKPAGGDNPFGGLMQGLLDAQKNAVSNQAGGQDCKEFFSMMSLQDMLQTTGNASDREKHKKVFDLHIAAVQAMLRQDWEDHIRGAREALAIEKEIGEWPSAVPRDIFMGIHWMNLAGAYVHRQQGDKADNLENGIQAMLKALEMLPKEGVCADQRGMAQLNLAAVYAQRIRGEKAENLELAAASLEAALRTISREASPRMWAMAQLNLGVVHANRIKGRIRDNQDRAIQAYNAALEIWDQQSHPHLRAMAQSNLGSIYIRRVSGDQAENIERGIAALEASLETGKAATGSLPQKPVGLQIPDIPGADNDFARELLSSVKQAYELTALADQSEGGGMELVDPTAIALSYQNLCAAYIKRIRGERTDNIERATAACDMALTIWKRDTHADKWATVQHNLGEALMLRGKGDRAANIEKAIETFRLALGVRTSEAFPRSHLGTATTLGQALGAKGDWAGALEAFDSARASFRVLFGQGLNEAEARDLLQEAGPLFTDAAYAAAAGGEVERAFDLLEEGKARLLAVALKLDRLAVGPADRKKLDDLRHQIREAEAIYEAAKGEEKAARVAHLSRLRADLLKLVDAAEAKSAAPRARDQVSRAQILPRNGALIAPIVSDAGAKAILVTQAESGARIEAVDLPGLDREKLNRFLGARDQGGWLGAYSLQEQGRLSEWFSAIKEGSDELGRLFGAPIVDALRARGLQPGTGAQLRILPVGPLGLLPLGLARHPATRRHLMEDYTVSFAPSVAALVAAQARASQAPREPTLTVVANPTEDLEFTEAESAMIAGRFAPGGRRVLARKQATAEAVLAALKGRDYWHFSSHGRFEWDDPRASGLFMAMQKPLTVGALMDAEEIGAPRLAVLSACETGLYDIATTPNEFIGLPAAFMRIGAGGVLATLWPVADLSTALLIARFYDLHRGETLAPAAALTGAQAWLRAATYAELRSYSQRAVEDGRLPQAFLQQIDAQLRALKAQQPSDTPFAHPYYWGGFTLTGL